MLRREAGSSYPANGFNSSNSPFPLIQLGCRLCGHPRFVQTFGCPPICRSLRVSILLSWVCRQGCAAEVDIPARQVYSKFRDRVALLWRSFQGFFSSVGSSISRVRIGCTFLPTIMLMAASGLRLLGCWGSISEAGCWHRKAGDGYLFTSWNVPISGVSASINREAILSSVAALPLLPSVPLIPTTMFATFPGFRHESSFQPASFTPTCLNIPITSMATLRESWKSSDVPFTAYTNTSTLIPFNPVSSPAILADCAAVNCLGPKISAILFSSWTRLKSAWAASLCASSASCSTFAISSPDNCETRTSLSNSPAIPAIKTIRDRRDSLCLLLLLFTQRVNSATNSPIQPRNTTPVEMYPTHSQQFNVDFSDSTSEAGRIILLHQKRAQKTLIACLVGVLLMLVMMVVSFIRDHISEMNKKKNVP